MSAQSPWLRAPVAGRPVALDQLPDPIFALGLIGDGIAIEPGSGEIQAPCAGRVVSIHVRHNAVTLRSDDGAEVLVHVGLEEVALKGEGFEVLVGKGQQVTAGEALLRFDRTALAQLGPVTTSLIVLDGAFRIDRRSDATQVEAGEPLLRLAPASGEADSEGGAEREVVVEMVQGFHARPAALLADVARGFEAKVRIHLDDRQANARSPVSLLTLDCRHGDRLRITASGEDADEAVARVAEAIASGLGDPLQPVGDGAGAGEATPQAPQHLDSGEPFAEGERAIIDGIVASAGVAIGTAMRFEVSRRTPPETGADARTERTRLHAAVEEVERYLQEQAENGRTEAQRDIAGAHVSLLGDQELMEAAEEWIDNGRSAGNAWCRAIEAQASALRALGNARLNERADDLVDIEQRVLAALEGESPENIEIAEDAILIAEDLLPSQFMALGDRLPAGFIIARGGRTSHVAILAASSGVPMLVAAGADALRIPDGATVVLDTEAGRAALNPSDEAMQAIRAAVASREACTEANRAAANDDCVMADGTRLPVYANVGSVSDAERAHTFGAEGSGLVRTEFLFLERKEAPTETEQRDQYQAMAQAMHGKPLTIRVLDIGGDKPIPYLPGQQEENPILGVRGIRMLQNHPDMLRQQLRSILHTASAEQCRIMLPMVTDIAELRWARAILEEEKRAQGIHARVPLGIMIEVPSAVALADQLAAEADFFSIGTNDLTQYVLAMDRGNAELAGRIDAFHPAVLRMIARTVAGARQHNRPVGVCGGLASELLAAPILIGLEVDSLSATRSVIPDLKAFIRRLDTSACKDIAEQALTQDNPEAVRQLVIDRWPDCLPPSLAGIVDGDLANRQGG